MSDTKDLINYAINQKPTDFNNVFQDLLLNKLQTAVANKKVEIAQGIFPEVEQEEPETEEQEETGEEDNG